MFKEGSLSARADFQGALRLHYNSVIYYTYNEINNESYHLEQGSPRPQVTSLPAMLLDVASAEVKANRELYSIYWNCSKGEE